jgi:hypothetical protein
MWNGNKIVSEVKHLTEMQGVFLLFGKFSVNYHIGILCLSTRWFIIKMEVEVDHDNIGYDKKVV